jgi:hypothetical protein
MAITTARTKFGYGSPEKTLPGLLEVSELGGDPEKIDVTTLEDEVKKYIPGVRDLGDLAFKFHYETTASSTYTILKGLQKDNKVETYTVTYPDGSKHAFSAYVSVKVDSAAVNGALTCTANFSLQSDITFTPGGSK